MDVFLCGHSNLKPVPCLVALVQREGVEWGRFRDGLAAGGRVDFNCGEDILPDGPLRQRRQVYRPGGLQNAMTSSVHHCSTSHVSRKQRTAGHRIER